MYILSRVFLPRVLSQLSQLSHVVRFTFVLLLHTSVSRKLSIRQKEICISQRVYRGKSKRAQKMRKDILSDTHKRQYQNEAKEASRLALQSNEN